MDTVEQIKSTMARHELNNDDMAVYLGVPVPTLIKWLNGTRKPSASAVRLVEVLGIIETMAPAIHNHLLP